MVCQSRNAMCTRMEGIEWNRTEGNATLRNVT